jgi:hypothetical protein
VSTRVRFAGRERGRRRRRRSASGRVSFFSAGSRVTGGRPGRWCAFPGAKLREPRAGLEAEGTYLGVGELAHGLALARVHELADLCGRWKGGGDAGERTGEEDHRRPGGKNPATRPRVNQQFGACSRWVRARAETRETTRAGRTSRTDDGIRRSIVEAAAAAATAAAAEAPSASRRATTAESSAAASETSTASRGRTHRVCARLSPGWMRGGIKVRFARTSVETTRCVREDPRARRVCREARGRTPENTGHAPGGPPRRSSAIAGGVKKKLTGWRSAATENHTFVWRPVLK